MTGIVVDDDSRVREVFARALDGAGIRAVTAECGETALELARSATPDFVVTDLEMPGLNGLGLCREIRRDPALKKLVIVVVSGAAFTLGQAARAAGCDVVLAKPCTSRLLLETIKQLVAKAS